MRSVFNAYLCVKAIAAGKRERNALALLQAGNHSKQVVGAGIALVAEHAHQALRVLFHFFGQGLKPNCCVHVVTQKHFAGFEIVAEKRADRLAEQANPKLRITLGACLDGILEISGQWPRASAVRTFRAAIVSRFSNH